MGVNPTQTTAVQTFRIQEMKNFLMVSYAGLRKALQ